MRPTLKNKNNELQALRNAYEELRSSYNELQHEFASTRYHSDEQRFRNILEQFPLPIVTYAPDGTFISANRAWEFMWQDSRENALSYNICKDPQMVSSGLMPYIERAFAGETVVSKPYLYNPEKDGKNARERWMKMVMYPYKNQEGKMQEVILVMEDVTERKIFEEERLKVTSDLIQRNKDLEQFTYIISHNLRAPVTRILGLSEIIEKIPTHNEISEEYLQAIKTSSQKLDEIIKDLNYILQVKNEANERKEQVYFSHVTNDIITSIQDTIQKEKAIINVDFSETNEIYSFRSYMHSIFYNLISNSIKYRNPNRDPSLHIVSRKKQNRILLSFKDNGLGIDLSLASNKIFGLYKRFHDHVEGKGMGLFMVKTQVEKLDGTISVKSSLNKGSEFTIEFKA